MTGKLMQMPDIAHGVTACVLRCDNTCTAFTPFAFEVRMHALAQMQVDIGRGMCTWLHVPVKVPVLMYVSKALQDLMHPAPYAGLWHKLVPVLCELIEIAIL